MTPQPDPYDYETLLTIDKRIDASEAEGIRERWEFGRIMLAARNGNKRLPNGYLADLVERTGKSKSELSYRIKFAEQYPTEVELSNALESFMSWHEVVESLYTPAPKPKTDESDESDEEWLARKLAEEDAARGEDGRVTSKVPATIKEAGERCGQLEADIRRMMRIEYARLLEQIESWPPGSKRDGAYVGLTLRHLRQELLWAFEDSGKESFEDFAEGDQQVLDIMRGL